MDFSGLGEKRMEKISQKIKQIFKRSVIHSFFLFIICLLFSLKGNTVNSISGNSTDFQSEKPLLIDRYATSTSSIEHFLKRKKKKKKKKKKRKKKRDDVIKKEKKKRFKRKLDESRDIIQSEEKIQARIKKLLRLWLGSAALAIICFILAVLLITFSDIVIFLFLALVFYLLYFLLSLFSFITFIIWLVEILSR